MEDALLDLAERPHLREVGVEEGVQVLVVPFDDVEVEVGAFELAGQRAQEVVVVLEARPVAEIAELQNGLAALLPGVGFRLLPVTSYAGARPWRRAVADDASDRLYEGGRSATGLRWRRV